MAGDLAQIAIEQVGAEIAGAAHGFGGGVLVCCLGIVHGVIMDRIRRPSNRNADTETPVPIAAGFGASNYGGPGNPMWRVGC